MKNEKKENLYNNLSAEISRLNISLTEFAEAIGMTRQAYNNKKRGISNWTLNEMVIVQKFINTQQNTNYTLDYLFKKD